MSHRTIVKNVINKLIDYIISPTAIKAAFGFLVVSAFIFLISFIVVKLEQKEDFQPVQLIQIKVDEQQIRTGEEVTLDYSLCNYNGILLTTLLSQFIPIYNINETARDAVSIGFNLDSGCQSGNFKIRTPDNLSPGYWDFHGTLDFQKEKSGETQRIIFTSNIFKVVE